MASLERFLGVARRCPQAGLLGRHCAGRTGLEEVIWRSCQLGLQKRHGAGLAVAVHDRFSWARIAGNHHRKHSKEEGLSHGAFLAFTGLATVGLIDWRDGWSCEHLILASSDFCVATLASTEKFLQLARASVFKILQPWMNVGVSEERTSTADDIVVHYRQRCYHMVFQRRKGPNGMARLLIASRGSEPMTRRDMTRFLEDLDDIAKKQLQNSGDFVLVIDLSQFVWPSLLSVPWILRTASRHEVPEVFKKQQQSFAIVGCQGSGFEKVIDAIVSIKKAQTAPIFASDVQDADRQLDERFRLIGSAHALASCGF